MLQSEAVSSELCRGLSFRQLPINKADPHFLILVRKWGEGEGEKPFRNSTKTRKETGRRENKTLTVLWEKMVPATAVSHLLTDSLHHLLLREVAKEDPRGEREKEKL